tara:strand:+ start:145 stop:783 length:639 start_codon:yes stop_codon:yes gene_type:complete
MKTITRILHFDSTYRDQDDINVDWSARIVKTPQVEFPQNCKNSTAITRIPQEFNITLGYTLHNVISIEIVDVRCLLSEPGALPDEVWDGSYYFIALDDCTNDSNNNYTVGLYNSYFNKHIMAKVIFDLQEARSVGAVRVKNTIIKSKSHIVRTYNNPVDIRKFTIGTYQPNGLPTDYQLSAAGVSTSARSPTNQPVHFCRICFELKVISEVI